MRASRDRSTPRSPSASDAGTPACAPPPDRSGIATTTPCAKASSRPSNANCSSAGGSGLTPKRGWPSSSSSRAGTIRDGATPPSDICHPSTTNGASYPPLAQIHNRPRNRVNSRHHDIWEVGRWLGRVCNGWLNYFAVPGSGRFIRAFLRRLQRRWMRALRRRSQRARFSWKRLECMTEILWPRASIRHPWPDQRFAVKHPR